MEVNIPLDHRKALASLARIEGSAFENIVEALRDLEPCLRLSDLRARVKTPLSSVSGADEQLTDALLAVATTSSRIDFSSDFFQAVVEAVSAGEILSKDQGGALSQRLKALLDIPVIRISTKSSTLQVAHDRVYNSARVVTDVRPVFPEPLGRDFRYMVIHHLHVTSMRDNRLEDLYIAMDDKDLLALRDTIDRACQKADVLRLGLGERGLSEIDGGAPK